MKRLYKLITLFLIVILTFGCAPKRQVQRIETDQTIDLSGRWNDSDSRAVSDELIKQLLNDNWINIYKSVLWL